MLLKLTKLYEIVAVAISYNLVSFNGFNGGGG